MITVQFMLEGSSEFTVPMPELPRTGEKVAVEDSVYQVTNVCWEIRDGQCSSALVIGEYSSYALARMPYQDYLSSRHWRRVRADAMARAVYACQLCNTKQATLDVHHRTYERRGYERPEDLIVLCRACHTKCHRDTGESHTAEDAVRLYGKKIGRPTPIIGRMIQEASLEYGIETVIRAIDVADGADVRKWTYIEGVLRNWKEQQAQA